MMRSRFFCICCLCLLLTSTAQAAVDTSPLEQALTPEAKAYVEISPQSGDAKAALSGILRGLLELLREGLRTTLSEGFLILAIAGLSGILTGLSGVTGSDVLSKTVDMASICAVTALCISGASGVLEACSDSINRLGSFSAALIPIYAAAVTVAGHPVSAVSTAAATLLFSNALLFLASNLLIPAIYLHIVLSSAGQVAENDTILGLAELFRKTALGFFKYFLMLYTGYISLSGLISSGTDAMTLRTAKMTISGSVPVLGSVISDVSEALLSGAVILKNAVGLYGFIGALAICLIPFAAASVRWLVFRFLAMLASGLTKGRFPRLLAGISESYSIALGLLGACCTIQFLSFVIGSVVIRP